MAAVVVQKSTCVTLSNFAAMDKLFMRYGNLSRKKERKRKEPYCGKAGNRPDHPVPPTSSNRNKIASGYT